MSFPGRTAQQIRTALGQARDALRLWTPRQIIAAVIASGATAVLIGIVTVLIPNPLFSRDVAPVAWNYPVWLLLSGLSGMLFATYVRPHRSAPSAAARLGGADHSTSSDGGADREADDGRGGGMGLAGGVLAWFAVGCPVCNKLVILALGYSGAMTWFHPVQPVLGVTATVLSAVALVIRLKGQIACPVPVRPARNASEAAKTVLR